MSFWKKNKKEEEKKFDEEFVQDVKDFSEYWQERLDACEGKSRSITINSKMVVKLNNILRRLN